MVLWRFLGTLGAEVLFSDAGARVQGAFDGVARAWEPVMTSEFCAVHSEWQGGNLWFVGGSTDRDTEGARVHYRRLRANSLRVSHSEKT